MHQPEQDLRPRLLTARLPALPHILLKLIAHLQADDLDMGQLAALIALDAGLTARILAAASANGHRHGPCGPSVEQALVALGADMLQTLVVSDSVAQTFSDGAAGADLRGFWQNALTAALVARALARHTGYAQPDEAYLAGLLHNLGRLALQAAAPRAYAFNFRAPDDEDLCAVEQRTLQLTHAEAGAWLVAHWRLDSFLDDAVLYHHEPDARLAGAHLLIRITRLAHLAAMHGDEPEVLAAAAPLCGVAPELLQELSDDARRQVAQTAAELGIDLEAAAPAVQDAPGAAGDALQQRLSEEMRNMVLVAEVGRSFARQPGDAGLPDAIARTARLLFDFDQTLMLLENPASRALVGVPGMASQRLASFAVPLDGAAAVARCASARAPAFLRRDAAGLALADEQLFRLLGAEALVCLPLVAGARCLGVLVGALAPWQLAACQQRDRFLRAFGAQAGGALENAWSERGHARRQLAQAAEELRAASLRVVHEVNTPLASIKRQLAALDDKLARQEPLGGELSLLNEEIERVSQLVNGLAEAGEPAAGAANLPMAPRAPLRSGA